MIEPLVDCVEDKQICTNVSRLITLDLNTVQKTDLVFEVSLVTHNKKNIVSTHIKAFHDRAISLSPYTSLDFLKKFSIVSSTAIFSALCNSSELPGA